MDGKGDGARATQGWETWVGSRKKGYRGERRGRGWEHLTAAEGDCWLPPAREKQLQVRTRRVANGAREGAVQGLG